jgi:hypothetical protein
MNHTLLYVLAGVGLLGIGLTLVLFLVCGRVATEPAQGSRTRIQDVPQEYWAELAGQRVFFGHQSVGYNLVAGIQDLMKEHPEIRLNVVESPKAAAFEQPVFAHAKVGRNGAPASKIEGFRSALESGVGGKVDIAFFKFCYVDIEAETDVVGLHEQYRVAMEALSRQYPRTSFLHVTTPLLSVRPDSISSPKQFLKVILRHGSVLEANRKREQYNTLLKASTSATNLFDLAFWETFDASGQRTFQQFGGQKVHVLAPSLTYDGGHLNARGRKDLAEQLLVALAKVAHERSQQKPKA